MPLRCRNWKLEGSLDGETWTVLRAHENDISASLSSALLIASAWIVTALRGKGATATWTIQTDKEFRIFRVTSTGLNSSGHFRNVAVSGFELCALSLFVCRC